MRPDRLDPEPLQLTVGEVADGIPCVNGEIGESIGEPSSEWVEVGVVGEDVIADDLKTQAPCGGSDVKTLLTELTLATLSRLTGGLSKGSSDLVKTSISLGLLVAVGGASSTGSGGDCDFGRDLSG